MGDRNTIVVVALVIFIGLTAAFSGVAFYYNLQAEDLRKTVAVEDKQIGDLRVRINNDVGTEELPVGDLRVNVSKGLDGSDPQAVPGLKQRIDSVKQVSAALEQIRGRTAEDIKRYQGVTDQNKNKAVAADKERGGVVDAAHQKTQAHVTEFLALYKSEIDKLKSMEDGLAKSEADLKIKQDALRETIAKESAEVKKAQEEINKFIAERDLLNAKIEHMDERQKQLAEMREDGKVIHSDPANDLVVVDLGAAQGVRPGMVFDVFEVLRDGNKSRKAKVQLQWVESRQSVAVVLAPRPAALSCPNCGWSTTDPTMIYCPYCRTGEGRPEEWRDVVQLQKSAAAAAITAPDFLNPVRPGDFITSPHFLGGANRKPLTFAFIGQPAERSRQEIAAFLKSYDCTLAEDITVSTDFALVGVGPRVEADLKKARMLGVAILRERDIQEFFGKRGISPEAPRKEADFAERAPEL